jgi:PAS domain S-box-containing protein
MSDKTNKPAALELGGLLGPLSSAVSGESMLGYIIANVPHSVFWKDVEGRFLGGNQNFLRDLRLSTLDQLVGKTDHDFGFLPEQIDFFRKCDQEVMQRGTALLDIEEPQDQPDGTHTLLTSKVPLRDRDGRVIGLLGIYVDITERKRMEEALRRAHDKAEASSRATSEFLTVVSHELRTPLTLILGPLEGLLAHPGDAFAPEVRADLERIHRNGARLLALVNDLIAFTTLSSGHMAMNPEVVDAGALVTGLVGDARPSATRAGLHLDAAVEGDLGHVTLDRRMFEKIVLNLVGNALKFTPSGGLVKVLLRAVDDQMELVVTDTGPGIPLDQQQHLFQRFHQIDSSTARKHEGTGIGLALVKELSEHMGGSAGVLSEPGLGARFWVRLPHAIESVATSAADPAIERRPGRPPRIAADEPAPPESLPNRVMRAVPVMPEPPVRATPPNPDLPRVLIADDNLDMRAWLSALLAPNYDVEAVEDGVRALAAARARPPAVIVSDLMMPEMDGLELVARLKADPALERVPVLLLTAKSLPGDVIAGLDAGANDYLSKPFSPAEFLARVRAAHRIHAAYEALDRQHRALQQAHEQLRQTQEQLIHSAKIGAIGTIVAGLCHELNNPLSVILMNTQGLLARTPTAETASRRALGMIERHTQRCARLVDNLLEVSRKKRSVRERLDVGALLGRLAELSQSCADQGEVRMTTPDSSEAIPEVMVCVQDLETVLLNLLSNALDANSQGGAVVLSAIGGERHGQRGLELSVRDSGCGIPADVLPHIFEPFFTTKPAGRGTGLGLAISRKIIEDHGGALDVETDAGGTTVRLWLPPAAAAPPGAPQ